MAVGCVRSWALRDVCIPLWAVVLGLGSVALGSGALSVGAGAVAFVSETVVLGSGVVVVVDCGAASEVNGRRVRGRACWHRCRNGVGKRCWGLAA